MSWQSYVDDHLVGSGSVTKACIVGLDGSVWATTPGLTVRGAQRHDWLFLSPAVAKRRLTRSRAPLAVRLPIAQVSAAEAKALIAGFADPSGLQASGIHVGGEKYMFIKAETGKEIIGKKVSEAERGGRAAASHARAPYSAAPRARARYSRPRRVCAALSRAQRRTTGPTRPCAVPISRTASRASQLTRAPLCTPLPLFSPGRPPIQGSAGMCAFKANTLVLISAHDDSIVPGACSATTGKLADYLIEHNM
jgi:hypothetical protein